jgi:uncharacterized protein (TIRG00374 family)
MTVKGFLKTILAAALLAYVIYKAGAADVWGQFAQITVLSIIFLLFISVVLIYISALKWKMFLEVFAEQISLGKLLILYLVGYFINLLLPSYVGGDAVRSWQIGKKVGQHEALAATVLERYTGVFAMLSMAFIFMWFINTVTFEIRLAVFVIMTTLVILTLLLLSPFFVVLLEKFKLPKKIVSHVSKIIDALHLAKSHVPLFAKALLLSYLYHAVAVVNVMAAAYAVGWKDAPFFSMFIILPLILTVGSLPITPSGLGLQEGAYFFFLQSLGATSSEATAVALVMRAKTYILAVFGGIFWYFLRKEDRNVSVPLEQS